MALFLIPDEIVEFEIAGNVYKINQRIMPDDFLATKDVASYVPKGHPMKPCAPLHNDGIPQGITVHNTNMILPAKGTNAAEQYARATYNGNMGGVIVHYYVWHDVIWQLLSNNERGWHATDGTSRRASKDGKSFIGGNMDTIAIEAIGSDDQTESTTAALCAWLCMKFVLLPTFDIYPHNYFYPAKNCPSYILPHWDAFLKNVKTAYLSYTSPEPDKNTPDKWAASSWEWVKRMGYMDGTRPHDYLTRQELSVVIDRVENQ